MKLSTRIFLTSLALPLLAAGGGVRAGEETCYEDWSEAAAIVKREGLATVAELTAEARGKVGGKVLRTQLCEDGGVFTYRLIVRSPHGDVKPVTVDARHPFAAASGKHD